MMMTRWVVLFVIGLLRVGWADDTPSPTPAEETPSPTPAEETPSPTPAPQPKFMTVLNGDITWGLLAHTGYATRRNVKIDATTLTTLILSAATLQTPAFQYGGAGVSFTDQVFWRSNGSVATSLTFSLNGGNTDANVYMYVNRWGGGRYNFSATTPSASVPFTVVSAQTSYSSYVGQSFTSLVVGSGTGFGTTFCGILMFPVGTKSIAFTGTGRLTDDIQYTLAYINPSLTPVPSPTSTPEPTPSPTPTV